MLQQRMIMKTTFRFLLVTVLFTFATQTYAQNNNIETLIQVRAAEKVKQMCDYIEFIANPENNRDIRAKYKGKAVRLFMANCEPYNEDGVQKKGVSMEITSTLRTRTTRRLMKDYFIGLMNMRYDKVKIQSSDIHDIQLSNLQKVDENTYVCTAVFIQVFIGYRDGKPVYGDRTKKSVKCYVFREETVEGDEYIVKLGDTRALSTEKIKL